ncbi:DUF4190 domain-containing protein [Demequina gelatinilytica]|uniref:DUF4190 domain-containing protein n=1 Tax=Demequina gelatinilytica TaxID=1638980 RepID=UPI000AA53DF7|nr:DUF4190 domain-containing protein [Demequina gelatinilytica]
MSSTPQDPFASGPQQPQQPPQDGPAPQQPPQQQPPQQPPPPQYAVPPGGVPPQQPPPAQYGGYGTYGPVPGTEKNWMGTASLVLSLVGLFTFITAIAGIVFGHLSLSAAKRGEADNRGMGIAGLVIGYLVVVLGILAAIAIFAIAGWFVTECGGDNPAEWCEITIDTSTAP